MGENFIYNKGRVVQDKEVAIPTSEVSELYFFDIKTKTHRIGTKEEIAECQKRMDEKVERMNEND